MVKKRKIKEERLIDTNFQTPQEASEHLTSQGYDKAAIRRFAAAARSWTKKDSFEWNMWKSVEEAANSTAT